MDFKIILFATLIILGVCTTKTAYSESGEVEKQEYVTSHSTDAPNNTIVMEDEVLRVDSGSESNPISQIKVYDSNNEKVHTEKNCNSSKCSTSLKMLPAGTYFVKVSTKGGKTFSGEVTKK